MNENDIDAAIGEALDTEDRALLEKYAGEPSLFELMGDTFRGRHRWLTIYVYFWAFVFFGIAIWCGIRFFDEGTDTTREIVGWATGFLVSIGITMMIKVWIWMEVQRHATLRAIKRLELIVARLSLKGDGRPSR